MEDTEARRRQRERLVAYFIGGLVREHGINLSNQPGPMARLGHFAAMAQEALEEDRLEALVVNDQQISTGLDGSPLPFRVNIDKNLLRAILDGTVPPPTDDAASAAAREARAALSRAKQAAVAEAQRRLEIEKNREAEEETDRNARELRRFRKIMLLSAVAFALAAAALVFFATHHGHDHETKSEDKHATH